MSGVDVADTIRTLATLVRLHEGNRDAGVNALLERAEVCCAAVAELVAEAQRVVDGTTGDLHYLRAALANVTGGDA